MPIKKAKSQSLVSKISSCLVPLTVMPWLLLLGNCTKDQDEVSQDAGEDLVSTWDLRTPDLAQAPDLETGCPRREPPADHQRYVVVSFPYDDQGGKAQTYGVLTLSDEGKLAMGMQRFQMGRATSSEIHFTPDGNLGLVAQEDGSIGVFALSAEGKPTVIHAAYKGSGYASKLVLDPSGQRVFVLNSQWRENGGGIYAARINCDGTLQAEGLLAASKLPYAMALAPSAGMVSPRGTLLALGYAQDLLDSKAGENVHLLEIQRTETEVKIQHKAGTDAFGDGDAMVASSAFSPDGKYALFGDNNEFSGTGNRLSVVSLAAGVLQKVMVVPKVNDPVSMVFSPFGNAGLVVNGYGNAVLPFRYDPAAAMAPVTMQPQPMYIGKKPALPDTALVISRGKLRGHVLLAENTGVRQLEFRADGTLSDLGLFSTGGGLLAVVGALGVQP